MDSPRITSFSTESPIRFGRTLSNSSMFQFDVHSTVSPATTPLRKANDTPDDEDLGQYDPKIGLVNLSVSDEDLSFHDNLLEKALQEAKETTKTHLISIKKRLIEEKASALRNAEQEYLNRFSILQDEITSLKREISRLESADESATTRRETKMETVSILLSRFHPLYKSKFSLVKIFHAWKNDTLSSRALKKLEKTSIFFSRKTLLSRTMSNMRANYMHRKALKAQAEAKFKFDSVTNEMVTRYESELSRMREDLRESYLLAESETSKRQQLESDLRRMFLKNMTHMNMEALSLFHDNYNNNVTATAVEHGNANGGVTSTSSVGGGLRSDEIMIGTDELVKTSGPPSAFGTNGGTEQQYNQHAQQSSFSARQDAHNGQQQPQNGHHYQNGSTAPPPHAPAPPSLSFSTPSAAPSHSGGTAHSGVSGGVNYSQYTQYISVSQTHTQGSALNSARTGQSEDDEQDITPRPSLQSQLVDAYRSSMSSTNKLAVNVLPPPRAQQHQGSGGGGGRGGSTHSTPTHGTPLNAGRSSVVRGTSPQNKSTPIPAVSRLYSSTPQQHVTSQVNSGGDKNTAFKSNITPQQQQAFGGRR